MGDEYNDSRLLQARRGNSPLKKSPEPPPHRVSVDVILWGAEKWI